MAKAEEAGTHAVADAYGFAWQTISSWKRYYGKGSDFDMSSRKENKNQVLGTVDSAYIRADEDKAYWVRGEGEKEEHGAVDLW